MAMNMDETCCAGPKQLHQAYPGRKFIALADRPFFPCQIADTIWTHQLLSFHTALDRLMAAYSLWWYRGVTTGEAMEAAAAAAAAGDEEEQQDLLDELFGGPLFTDYRRHVPDDILKPMDGLVKVSTVANHVRT